MSSKKLKLGDIIRCACSCRLHGKFLRRIDAESVEILDAEGDKVTILYADLDIVNNSYISFLPINKPDMT